MYTLNKRGITTNLWRIIKELNSNLLTTVQTKYGPTRQIRITDSIRQGGVLSVNMYALLMDETNKALQNTELGIKIPRSQIRIPCLLWMDDVVLEETETTKSQKQLDITDDISMRYRVEYGMAKTNILRTGKNQEKIVLKLGDKRNRKI